MVVFSGIVVIVLGHLSVVVTTAPRCEDLNTAGCVLFQQSVPDLCSDPVMSNNCKRFCGLCPLVCYECPQTVSSPGECNETMACAPGEKCMVKHHTLQDGSQEYLMSCESNQTCEGLNFGFHNILGRRDVNFHCCDTDLCNLPAGLVTTTTTPATTTTTPANTTTTPIISTTTMPSTTSGGGSFTHGSSPKPPHCMKDVVFVIDGSSSVGSNNHQMLVQFVERVIQGLNIGPRDVLVSVVEYSNSARIEWYLNAHHDKASLLSAVKALPYLTGTTATDSALWMVREFVLTSQRGDRPDASNLVVLITDGGTNDHHLAEREAQLLSKSGTKMVVLGVGSLVDQHELVQFASPEEVYITPSFSQLAFSASSVTFDICPT